VFEDRRRGVRVQGDRETLVASGRVIASLGPQVSRTLLATAGDRLALERFLFTGPDGRFEVEALQITEVDAEGRIVAMTAFDADDRGAALGELHDRFAAGEAVADGGQAPVAALHRAFWRHDWEAVRGCFADEARVQDHRKLGLGTFDADAWVESWRVLAELAPDLGAEVAQILAWSRHGQVSLMRVFGTWRDAGPFENVFVGVLVTDRDRVACYEVFDVEDAALALARFEDLSVDLAAGRTRL
jgi:hypothetical protein